MRLNFELGDVNFGMSVKEWCLITLFNFIAFWILSGGIDSILKLFDL